MGCMLVLVWAADKNEDTEEKEAKCGVAHGRER